MGNEEPESVRLSRELAEAAAADPIRMVLIVRESLGLSVGKLAAQMAHAGQLMQQESGFALQYMVALAGKKDAIAVHDRLLEKVTRYGLWLRDHHYAKIVKTADEKEWIKVKALFPHATDNALEKGHVVVVDIGLNEVAANTETVLALWPMRARDWPPLIKRLRLLT